MNNTENEPVVELVETIAELISRDASINISGCTSPEEYKSLTGKRFRMTKEQKQRGISREVAFAEFISPTESTQSQEETTSQE
jgi:hypothetical protein